LKIQSRTLNNKAKPLPSSNSRPSTTQGPSLSPSEVITPSLVIPLQVSKTPYNVTKVNSLLINIKDKKVNIATGLKKLAKVAEFSLAKVTVVKNLNQDLVTVGKEAQKKKNQESRDLSKARVLGQEALKVQIASYFDK
jgi:hypothetical protein